MTHFKKNIWKKSNFILIMFISYSNKGKTSSFLWFSLINVWNSTCDFIFCFIIIYVFIKFNFSIFNNLFVFIYWMASKVKAYWRKFFFLPPLLRCTATASLSSMMSSSHTPHLYHIIIIVRLIGSYHYLSHTISTGISSVPNLSLYSVMVMPWCSS